MLQLHQRRNYLCRCPLKRNNVLGQMNCESGLQNRARSFFFIFLVLTHNEFYKWLNNSITLSWLLATFADTSILLYNNMSQFCSWTYELISFIIFTHPHPTTLLSLCPGILCSSSPALWSSLLWLISRFISKSLSAINPDSILGSTFVLVNSADPSVTWCRAEN